MPESRPPIELQGLSLAELQKLIDERRLPPVDQWNPERCGHSGCASPATAPGITTARRSAARRWSGCSRPSSGASPTAAMCWSRRSRSSTSTSTRTAFRAVEMSSEGEGRDQPHRLPARQRRCRDPRARSSAADRRDGARPLAAPARPPRAGGRAHAAGLLRACRDCAGRRRQTRPASGATAHSSRWTRDVTLADRLRAALRGAAGRAAARGRPARASRASRRRRRRCWSRSPTGPSRA